MKFGGKPPMSKSGLICLNIGWNGNKFSGSIMTGTTWPSWTGRFWTCRKYDPSKRRRPSTLTQCHIPEDFNPLTPNGPYSGRNPPLISKRYILYIYSTNVGTEYCKHDIYSPFFSLQNAVCFIILTYLVPVLFTFYIQDVLKLKK